MRLSVIIPVYNTKKYLPECLDSVLEQSLEGIEILIVDDGSDDGSWEVIQQYQSLHDNILTFQQQRKRQGAARNLALRHAAGEFVAFLDSDDTIPPTAYQHMYAMAQENSSDMVVGVQQSFSPTRRWVGVPVHRNHFGEAIHNTNIIEFPDLLSDISACNKLIRRSKLNGTGILFPEQKAGEDLDFMGRVFLEFNKISILPEVVYNYRARVNASTGRIKASFFQDRVSTTHSLYSFYEQADQLAIFQFLLRSEIRKLVGNRLSKVIGTLPGKDQREIVVSIQSLVHLVQFEALRTCKDLSPVDKMKIILLKENEIDALYRLIGNENGGNFLKAIKNTNCVRLVHGLWKEHKRGESSLSSLQKVKRFIRPKYFLVKRFLRRSYYLLKRVARAAAQGNFSGLYCVIKYLVIDLSFLVRGANKWDEQEVWLIDERWAQSAEDNSLHFFIYLRTQHPDLPVYYIIKKNSVQRGNVQPYGNVVILFSWEHLRLLRFAQVLISTDGFKALAFPFELIPFIRRKTFNVFLQHGVSGNKTMSYYKERHPYFNMVVTSNEREKLSFVDVYGFHESEVVVTGIARFDKLPLDRKEYMVRKILVAPTWRKWLANKHDIRESIYYKEWAGLLKSEKFIKMLENRDIQLVFQPHFNMMRYIHDFEGHSKNIKIITESDEPLQKHIIESDLLVTDYSSVMYDFFYQYKPVCSIMFDKAEWYSPPNGPPLIDFEHDLPAVIFENSEQFIQAFENITSKKQAYTESDVLKVARIFQHRDHENCKRIYEHIRQKMHGE